MILFRPLCWLYGHINAAYMKPEELFGPYIYSKLFCKRCGLVFASNPTTPDDIRRWEEYLREHE